MNVNYKPTHAEYIFWQAIFLEWRVEQLFRHTTDAAMQRLDACGHEIDMDLHPSSVQFDARAVLRGVKLTQSRLSEAFADVYAHATDLECIEFYDSLQARDAV